MWALRDSIESSSLSYNFCNSSAKSIAKSNESGAITETVWEEEESEEFKDSEPVRKKKEESRFISGFQSQNQQQNQDRRILKVQNRISEQNQVKNQKNLPLSYAWTSVSPNQRRSVRVQKVRFKKNETLTFFQNRKGFQGLQHESTVVNPWIHEKFHQNEDLNQKRTKEPIETREQEFRIYSDSVNTCEFQ